MKPSGTKQRWTLSNRRSNVPKSSIEKLGAVESVDDFSSLMDNTIIILAVLVDHKEMEKLVPQSVLRYIPHKFVLIVNSAEWDEWVKVTEGGQCLHHSIYQLYE